VSDQKKALQASRIAQREQHDGLVALKAEIERLTAALAERQQAIDEAVACKALADSLDAMPDPMRNTEFPALIVEYSRRNIRAWAALRALATPAPAEQDDDEITAHPKGWHSTPKDFPS